MISSFRSPCRNMCSISTIIKDMHAATQLLTARFNFVRSPHWLFQQVMSCGKKSLDTRKHSNWNVFMSKRMKEINAGKSEPFYSSIYS